MLYGELVERLPDLCDRVESYRALWGDEDATLSASEAALASGAATISEVPDLDLAVIQVAASAPDGGGHRFGGQWVSGLHPIAVHAATRRGALLTMRGSHYELAYRYESWVQFRSRPVRARVDLAPLAVRLNQAEAGAGGAGRMGGRATISGLTPTLAPAARGRECAGAGGRARPRSKNTCAQHRRRGTRTGSPAEVGAGPAPSDAGTDSPA